MRPCPSFPGHSATENGIILSHRVRAYVKGRVGSISVIDQSYCKELKTFNHQDGYLLVHVFNGVKWRIYGVHQVVADAFLGPRPGKHEVRHLDGDPTNNRPSNLLYGTHAENEADKKVHGTHKTGVDHHQSRWTQSNIDEIFSMRKDRVRVIDVASHFGCTLSTIENVLYSRKYAPSNG